MEITIDTPETLLEYIKKDTVSCRAAIDIFEGAFSIVAIIFVDAVTKEPQYTKEDIINKIEEFINEVKRGGKPNKVILFN